MPTKFEERKQKILDQLAIPDQEYTDLSPKGSVDEGVRELCNEINAFKGLVTTSSCAGRIAVFLDGEKKTTAEDEDPPATSAGGKGGGRWLFVSHDPLDEDSVRQEGALMSLFGMDKNAIQSIPSSDSGIRFVHFRFEPMILHVLTSSLSNAQHVLSAGMTAGFRESGVSSVTGTDPTPMVAIRTQGISLSSIIGYQNPGEDVIKPMVSEGYLRTLLRLANLRFVTNQERKERFRNALFKLVMPRGSKAEDGDWEPADVRKERKRAEGLRRKEEMRLRKSADRIGSNEKVDYDVGLMPDEMPP